MSKKSVISEDEGGAAVLALVAVANSCPDAKKAANAMACLIEAFMITFVSEDDIYLRQWSLDLGTDTTDKLNADL